MERLFDRSLFEVAQPVRIDEIIGCLSGADLLELMVDPEKHDELKRVLEIIGILLDDRMHAPQRFDPLQRRGFGDPL